MFIYESDSFSADICRFICFGTEHLTRGNQIDNPKNHCGRDFLLHTGRKFPAQPWGFDIPFLALSPPAITTDNSMAMTPLLLIASAIADSRLKADTRTCRGFQSMLFARALYQWSHSVTVTLVPYCNVGNAMVIRTHMYNTEAYVQRCTKHLNCLREDGFNGMP